MNKYFKFGICVSVLVLSACGKGLETLPDDLTQEEIVDETAGADEAQGLIDNFDNPATQAADTQSRAQILAKYSHLDPQKIVPSNLLKKAVLYFDANQSKVANKSYLSVIDFSARSTKARFFIINVTSGAVWAIHVAHGTGSDRNADGYAESFSNVSGSNASSLGYYLTAETYYGKHGLSLRLDGLSSTNSRVRARAVVIHGSTYVKEANVVQGRSWGCPAVADSLKDEVIKRLKGGSIIYAGLSASE